MAAANFAGLMDGSTQPKGFPGPLASWGRRVAAMAIDLFPLVLLSFVDRPWVSLVLAAGYLVLLGRIEGLTGQTPGKAILGLKVVDGSGMTVGPAAGVGRKALHVLDLVPAGLGFVLPLVHVRRQTIADRIMATYVVSGVPPRHLSLALWIPPRSD
jgi:uncharacterized RDD family membrane protein YckC